MSQLRVGILGGGLAGALLLRSLLPLKNLKVDIFESRPEFREQGSAIGLQKNALQALESISPELLECLKRAGAVEEDGAIGIIATGADAGKLFKTKAREGKEMLIKSVARAPFLREILAGVPDEAMHTGKRMVKIEENADDTYTVHFEDGSHQDFDVVFGADGIHSSVRKHILGQDSPYASPVAAGWWFYFTKAPIEEVRAVMGDEYLDEPRQNLFAGHRSHTLFGWTDDKKSIWGAAGARFEDGFDPHAWKLEVTDEQFDKVFKNDMPQSRDLAKLLRSKAESSEALCMFHHPTTPTYVRKGIACVGDAAHAPVPWQGSGGGMSIEDAALISTLMSRVKTRDEIPAALQAYDEIRRPRCQAVIDTSYEVGLLISGIKPGVGLDPEKLTAELGHKWDHIKLHDIEAAKRNALDSFAGHLSKSTANGQH